MDGASWIASLSDTMGDWLEIAVYAGAYAGLLAIVVCAINMLFRRWLSAAQMGLLWSLVLLRLVVPIAPGSSLSLDNLVKFGTTQAMDTQVAGQATLPYQAAAPHAPDNVRKLTELNLPTVAPVAADEST